VPAFGNGAIVAESRECFTKPIKFTAT
jgi:hypothetical protein